ncbi:histidine kinase-, DNA gyrase B-, and HSP90-like ATPase family protein [Clostridium sporogenes]|uniref:ATP-binding protein n=1 Tax=Clostridium TaxID=1485 RepID=UPI00090AF35F|nr:MULTISPECIES: ATP-binding protein [Clostridium]APF26119.1 histidine kinase-, DNA gyrase B-, and HSP90-like ATPase family protein [Clostridium sporogenes]MDI6918198.1 ATP-binding protein [Clostridium botulinum]WMU98402.1 ATP-binding protein [Clostridium botulinum]
MNSSITVSGNIISELSEKIPSNIIALNELIKNSYDAGANAITIRLDTIQKKLTVIDDGSGMNKKDIDTLFHVSSSEKKYGKINEYGRYTQGSKGLGFLSVFKFGDYVVWQTKKEQGFKFEVDYKDLINSDNISNYDINIVEDKNIEKGTRIDINLSDYNLKVLKEYFNDEKNYEKILNAFWDNNITIILEIDKNKFSNENKIKIKDYLPKRQLYYVKYNSKTKNVEYYYNDILILDYFYEFSTNAYELDIELQIFQFEKGDKKNISKLFYNPQNDLTPLIYINSNLFNNYSIFDPNVMKNIKSGMSLNQMIGYIKIIGDDKRITFNSDRTQFSQNELTDEIIRFLNDINKFIQKNGSKYKKHLVKLDFLSKTKLKASDINNNGDEIFRSIIKDTFAFKDKVDIKVEEDIVMYSIFGKQIKVGIEMDIKPLVKNNDEKIVDNVEDKEKSKENLNGDEKLTTVSNDEEKNIIDNEKNNDRTIIPAIIVLKNKNMKLAIPSKQINLYDNIKIAKDSTGNIVDLSKIEVVVDGVICRNNVLESVNSVCSKKIKYSYLDCNTGLVIVDANIKFYQPQSSIEFNIQDKKLISIPTKKNYSANFNCSLSRLVDQINVLSIDDYCEVIACSLRSIFEISIDSIIKSGKFINIFQNIKKLEERVGKVIEHIKSKNSFMSAVAIGTSIDYDSLKNILQPSDFKAAIEKANLGAHKSTTYISKVDIEHLGKIASLFIIITNEMINNDKIT